MTHLRTRWFSIALSVTASLKKAFQRRTWCRRFGEGASGRAGRGSRRKKGKKTRPSREASFPKRSNSGDPHRSRGEGGRARAVAGQIGEKTPCLCDTTACGALRRRRARLLGPQRRVACFLNRQSRTFLSNSRNFGSVDMGRPVADAGAGAGAGAGVGGAGAAEAGARRVRACGRERAVHAAAAPTGKCARAAATTGSDGGLGVGSDDGARASMCHTPQRISWSPGERLRR